MCTEMQQKPSEVERLPRGHTAWSKAGDGLLPRRTMSPNFFFAVS